METDIITVKVQYEDQETMDDFLTALQEFLRSHSDPQLIIEIKSIE